jgi:hypothetical protein
MSARDQNAIEHLGVHARDAAPGAIASEAPKCPRPRGLTTRGREDLQPIEQL